MKKNSISILLILCVLGLLISCSDDNGTGPVSKRMRTYARLSRFNYDQDVYSSAYIVVDYYPAVNTTEFSINDSIVFSSDYPAITGRTWDYDLRYDEPEYQWVTSHTYDIEIRANNNELVSSSSCVIPQSFYFNFSSIPQAINPDNGFNLEWTDCDNETYYRLFYSIWCGGTFADSLIILDANTVNFVFTPEMLNIYGAEDIYISLKAINGPVIAAGSEGNFSGDGYGYCYGEYDPGSLDINYLRSTRIADREEEDYNERNEYLFKKLIGFEDL